MSYQKDDIGGVRLYSVMTWLGVLRDADNKCAVFLSEDDARAWVHKCNLVDGTWYIRSGVMQLDELKTEAMAPTEPKLPKLTVIK